MTTTELHQRCIDILDGIKTFERRKASIKKSISGFPGTFSELRNQYENRIDIIDRCIVRLHERYERTLTKLINLHLWRK